MLKDPKAAAFTENFVGQWLGLREIDFTEPSHMLYPEFDDMLKVSMVRETELFFDEVLKDDLSLTNFVASDFTMLNGRLAKHYGIPGVDGWEFRKVTLPPDSHRGGVLTMASVLKVTANGTTTSPVMRGAWVLDRILGTPPPPPPADVPGDRAGHSRGDDDPRATRQAPRRSTSCAACHAKIDPPGFALESFDVIGGWREHYRTTGNGERRHGRRPADAVPPGQAGRSGRRDARRPQVREHRRVQATAARTTRTSSPAPWRQSCSPTPPAPRPTAADQPEIEAIVGKIRDKEYGLRSLVHEIVQSDVFRHK